MKTSAADNEGEGSLKVEFPSFCGHDQNAISREGHENAIHKVKAELSATKRQCDDLQRQLAKKEEAAAHARQEVETLKKLMNHSTSMAAAVQRDHAVAAVTEKDMILQKYRVKIDNLHGEIKQSRKREEDTVKMLQNEIKVLRESLAASQIGRLNKEPANDALAPSNVPPTDLPSENVENFSPSTTGSDVPAKRTGEVINELETPTAAQDQHFRVKGNAVESDEYNPTVSRECSAPVGVLTNANKQ